MIGYLQIIQDLFQMILALSKQILLIKHLHHHHLKVILVEAAQVVEVELLEDGDSIYNLGSIINQNFINY